MYKELSFVEANDGAYIKSETPIENQNLELIANKESKFVFTVSCKNLTAFVERGAKMSIEGGCENLKVKACNGSSFDALALKTTLISAKAHTGAIVKLSSAKRLDAGVFANGQICYRGSPELVVNQIFGGSVERIKD